MKIAICARTWGELGGIGVYTRNLLEAMLPLGSRHQFIVFYRDRRHVGRFSHYPHVKEVFVPARAKLLWDQIATPYYAAKHNVDLIFHPKTSAPLLSTCKSVMVAHGSERFVYPQFSHRTDILFFRTLYRLYIKRATTIISVSHNATRDLIHFLELDPRKVITIHLAPAPHFRKIEDAAVLESIRAKYNLSKRFILNVGLIYPGKNIPNLLRALKLVRQHEDVDLVIAGTGRRMYEEDLKEIDELGLRDHVSLPGYVPHDELPAFYNLAEAVAFPSFYESFPAIPLEAMACGCPVMISNTGGSPEAAGDAALYVDPHNVQDIALGMTEILTNSHLRQTLITRGFVQAQRFSWQTCAEKTLHVFERL